LNLMERQHWQLQWDVGRLVLATASALITHRLGASARICLAAHASVMALAYVVHLALCYTAIRTHGNRRGSGLASIESPKLIEVK